MTLVLLATLQATGLALALYAATVGGRRLVGAELAPVMALTAVPVIGLAGFWLVFLVPQLGPGFTLAVWALVAVGAGLALRGPVDVDAAVAGALWAAWTIGLLLWGFGPTGTDGMTTVATERWTHKLPPDNVIPLIFARGLEAGHVPSPMLGDWLSSDRPPLQTGLYLAFRLPWVEVEAAYQVVSTAFQLLVLPAAYHLGRALGADRPTAVAGCLAMGFAPVTLIHGLYVWPKLLCAALLLGVLTVHFTSRYAVARAGAAGGALVGTLGAGAVLAHGGGAFALIGCVLAAVSTGRLGTPRYVAAATLALVLLYAPWTLYQRYVDPPGDRLIKWHLAGVVDAGDPRPAGEALRDFYASRSLADWVDAARDKTLKAFEQPLSAYRLGGWPPEIRGHMFNHPIPAMGAAGLLTVLALPALLAVRRLRPLLLALLLGTLAWIALISRASDVLVHQGSLVFLTAPLIAAATLLAGRPVALWSAVAVQAGVTVYWFAA